MKRRNPLLPTTGEGSRPDPPTPEQLIPKRYGVLELVSSGASASVFKVRDEEDGTVKALKLLSLAGSGPTQAELFKLEFARVSSLRHPSIVRVHDFGSVHARSAYFVMDYLEGAHFDRALKGESFNLVAAACIQISDALSYVHARGMVHGDIKSSNILVSVGREAASDGSRDVKVTLTDFGLTRMVEDMGLAGGTLAYVAPEVIRGLPVDGRTDLYSLGAMLYEVLTGSRLFPGASGEYLLRAHLLSKPASPRDVNPSLSASVQNVLLRLLEKDPDRRYQTAEELAEAVRDAAGIPQPVTVTSLSAVTLLSPEIVGREEELEALKRSLSRVLEEGKGGLIFIMGDQGAGKSRLAEWLRFTASVEGARVGHLECGEQDSGSAARALQWSGRLARKQPVGETEGRRSTPGAGECPSLISEIYPTHEEQEDPCVVVFEDIHLAPVTLLAQLLESVKLTRAFPLLIVCTCEPSALDSRPDERSVLRQLRAHPASTSLELSPLSGESVASLVSSMLGSEVRAAPQPLTDLVFSASRGIPGSAEELVRRLADGGHIKRLGKRLVCDLPDETQIVPTLTLPDGLMHQVQRLPTDEREFLEAASVAGNVFALETITRLLGARPDIVARAADRLIEKQLLTHVGPGRYAVSRAQTAPLMSRLMPEETAKRLHMTMARLLEEEGEEADVGLLVVHYEAAGQAEKALSSRLSAVERALRRERYEDALAQAEAALPGVRSLGRPQVLGELLDKAAQAAEKVGRSARAVELSEEHLRLVPESDAEKRLAAILRTGRLLVKLSRFAEAQAQFSTALELAARKGLGTLRVEAMADLAWALFMVLRYDEALGLIESASALEAVRSEPRLQVLVNNRRGVILARIGKLIESEQCLREAVRLAETTGDAGTTASALINLSLTLIRMGQFEEAESTARRACAKAQESGDVTALASCYNNLGLAERALFKLDEALDSNLKAMELRKRCGDFAGSSRTALNVAALYRLRGEMGPALRYNEESYRLAAEFISDGDRSVVASNIGEIHGMRGDVAQAEKYYLEALAVKEKAGDPNGVAMCAVGLGYVFLWNGDIQRAMHWAERAVATSTEEAVERTSARLLLAEVLVSSGKLEDANREVDALTAQAARPPDTEGLLRRVRGMVQEKSGRLADAVETFRSSCSVLGGSGDALERARSLYCLGRALVARSGELGLSQKTGEREESVKEAVSALEEACRIFDRMQAGPESLSCLSALAGAYREMLALPGSEASTDDAATLLKAAELVNSALPCSAVLDRIMDLAIEKTGAERGLVALVNEESGEMEKVLSRSLEDEAEEDAFEISRTVVRRVAHGGAALLTADACEDPNLKDVKSVARLEIRSVLCVPLRARGKVIGAVYLDNRTMPGAFGPRQAGFMEGFADLAGMAVENSRLREELEQANERLSRENIELRKQVASTFRIDQMVGESLEMKAVFAAIEKVARTNATVLIVGESGTGKELVARAIHYNSSRKEGPFIAVDCVAIPKDLIEGELFGIEDRVATGVSKRIGYFEQADRGTIFLDEIGDMGLELQAKLLRVLQEREFRRIGGRHSINVDVRIVCATNKNLLEEFACGRFRPDLYHRISGIPIELPPLRQRRGDIPRLVKFFLKKYCDLNSVVDPPRITPELMKILVQAEWEGNVRQLENCIERFVIMSQPGQEVPFELLPDQLKQKAGGPESTPRRATSLREELRDAERHILSEALIRNKGNRSKTARELGLSEQSVRYKIRQLRIDVKQICRE